jgi:alcohol/geraniol dehydrogenase (NADP+)
VSSSRDKEEHARELGAEHFVATRGTDELRKAVRSFDFIFSTVSGDLPWDEYVAALRPQGKLCIIGIPDRPVTFGAFGLIGGEKSIVGGQTGSVSDTTEMLAFTARHRIEPIIETFAMGRSRSRFGTHPIGQSRFRPGGLNGRLGPPAH